MRTAVTLDADVEMLLRRAVRESQQSFKEVLNNALRRGLEAESRDDLSEIEIHARPLKMRTWLDPARLHHVCSSVRTMVIEGLESLLREKSAPFKLRDAAVGPLPAREGAGRLPRHK